MNILIICIELIAEVILFLSTHLAVMILDKNNSPALPRRVIISSVLIGFVSAIFYSNCFLQNVMIQILLLTVNGAKFCIANFIIYRHSFIRVTLVTLIIQFMCGLFDAAVFLFILQTDTIDDSLINALIFLIVRCIVFIILFIVSKKSCNNFIANFLPKTPNYILAMILINIFISDGLVYTSGFSTTDIQLKNFLIKILAFANTLCLIVVLVSLLTNVLFRQYQKDINKILENQVQIQLKHYEKSEKINTEIRRFRHDYNNHMNCMKSLVQSGRYDELMDYVNNISDAFPQSGFLYNTGNYIADAILTDKLENARKNGTNISFKGIISPSINNTDLCIILGNILDNAVEACEKIDGEKEISVFGGYQHGYFILIVKNPISCHVQTENGIPATTKPDTAYHGFGLQNVESVVKKYDGIMLSECSDDSFTIRLTFNSIQETATV